MTKKKHLVREFDVEVNGKNIEVCQIVADTYGNPRFVVHFRDLGISLEEYDNINKKYGFKKYRAQWYGGGIVFQSYNIADTLEYALDTVKEKEAVK